MSSQRIKYLGIAVLCSFILITGLISVRRSLKGSNDFDTYYNAGKAVWNQTGIYYQREYYQDINDVGPFLYPPPAACFFALFSIFPLSIAAFVWNLISVGSFCLSVWIILRLISPQLTIQSILNKSNLIEKCLVGIALFSLLLDNLTMAQINIMVLLMALGVIYFWRKGYAFGAGIILAFSICIKLTPAIFILYFLIKRQWKVLAGTLAGGVIFAILCPLLMLGAEPSRIYYRQWIGRTIKPGMIDIISKFEKYEPHPNKKSPEQLKMMRLGDMMVDKNQALEATMTRLLLKDRNDYAMSTAFPIYVARRYMNLPVLGRGIPLDKLGSVILVVKLILLSLLFWIWWKSGQQFFLFEMALAFLSMPLFSPFARTHHLIVLMVPYLVWIFYRGQAPNKQNNLLNHMVRFSVLAYFLLSIPYGKAAGMGTLAIFCLWIGFIVFKPKLPREKVYA